MRTQLMTRTLFASVLSCAVLVACSEPNPDLVGKQAPPPPVQLPKFDPVQQPTTPPPPTFDKVEQPAQPEKPVFPKVEDSDKAPVIPPKQTYHQTKNMHGEPAVPMDILFVVDTSASMCPKQANVRKNIQRFVEGFLKNNRIDFHIGVTTAWDSNLFGTSPRKFRNGELRPIKVRGRDQADRFITPKTKDLQNTLANTLDVGVEDFKPQSPSTSGPEREEVFSPIEAAFSSDMLNGPNSGFRRPEAHLAVVILTDSEDLSPGSGANGLLPATDVVQTLSGLIDTSKGETLTVLAALSRYNETVQLINGTAAAGTKVFKNPPGAIGACKMNQYSVDPDLQGQLSDPLTDKQKNPIADTIRGPKRIVELVSRTSGAAFDFHSNDYGTQMARLGQTLIKKAIQYRVHLDHWPDTREPMTVKVNGKVIKVSDTDGWSYDPDSRSIKLNEGMELGDQDQFVVDVDYTIFN